MRLLALENHVAEEAKAKAKEVAKPATVAVEKPVEEQSFERRLRKLEETGEIVTVEGERIRNILERLDRGEKRLERLGKVGKYIEAVDEKCVKHINEAFERIDQLEAKDAQVALRQKLEWESYIAFGPPCPT